MIGPFLRLRVFLRSFAIQGSWNYRTLLGTGFAFALLPVLRVVYRERTALHAAVDRHASLFNSHPYLAGIALGAVARLEADGAPPELIERFKAALRGSLGQLGDRLVWAGWRPACVLLALALLLAGLPWWGVLAVFLLVYNAGHIALRWWALRTGFESGRQVAERVRAAGLDALRERIATAGALGTGVLLPLLVVRGAGMEPVTLWGSLLAASAAALGVLFGARIRTPVIGGLTALIALGFLLKVTQ
ncbi:MAG TPA: PTS system mannose/fructose/sorbose family transporter subunit IID [Longimicrobiales bacterium]|nr:PTS system mannose/fructose/sorbose family transporter subunit IID [Longimicrobiales bacterium]